MRITTIIKISVLVLISLAFLESGWCFAESKKEDKKVEQDNKDSSSYSYGRYQLFFGAMRTKYKDSRHEIFFPTPQWGFSLGCDYYFFRKYVGLGTQFKLGFWKDRGHPSKTKPTVNESVGYQKDDSISLTRAIIPLSLSLVLNVTPLMDDFYFIPKKFISIKAWFGGEYLYGREQRDAGEDTAYIDKIRKKSIIFGVSPGVRISMWDRRSVNTLSVMNIRDIYLYPYMEWSKERGSGVVSFDRKIFGILLSFETI